MIEQNITFTVLLFSQKDIRKRQGVKQNKFQSALIQNF